MAKDLVTKTKVAPFISKTAQGETPDWAQIKKSTAFTLTLNPQTKTFDFISSDIAEEEVESYQPSLTQDVTMFKGEEDYQIFFDMVYELPTGEKAHRDFLIVFYQEEREWKGKRVFKAWMVDSLVKLNQMDTVNENISIDFSLSEPKKGAVQIVGKKPVFTEGTFDGEEFTAADGSDPAEESGSSAPATHTVTFDANGGTGTDPEIAMVEDGGTYRLPANPYAAPDGQRFKAWEAGGVEYGAGDEITVMADVTVKAVWEADD